MIYGLIEMTDQLGSHRINIHLTANYDTWKQRILVRGVLGSLTWEKADQLYHDLTLLGSNIRGDLIDTSKLSIDQSVNLIISKISKN